MIIKYDSVKNGGAGAPPFFTEPYSTVLY